MNELDEPKLLKKYLLGLLDDEAVQAQIEERLMVDEEFAARVSVVEEDLIEEFLDGEMTADERDRFNRFFLAPPERKRQLRLTRDLRRVSASTAENVPQPERSRSIFSIGWLRYAFATAAVVLVALGVWRFAIYESDTDKGLGALRAAYRGQRPVQPRITGLDSYAPYSETRGPEEHVGDRAQLNRAGLLLIEAANDSGSAADHQALANYYIARGQLVDAEREMKLALDGAPNDARVQSDAGAMYFEMARNSQDDAVKFKALDESLKHLDRAIAIDPNLLEPLFNRGLALEQPAYSEQAKDAWRKYLEHDSSSEWAKEAKQHLEDLERETPKERSAEALEADFMTAFRGDQMDEASHLVRLNRELVKDKYLPVRLAMRYLAVPEDKRDEIVRALEYCGKIEMKLTGDPFAKEIALFYRAAHKEKLEQLRSAHQALRDGYRSLEAQSYEGALPSFQEAQKTFDESGDVFTARIAQYYVAYSLNNLHKTDEAYNEFNSVETWAAERKFSWLHATALHWVALCLMSNKRLTEARRGFEKALSIADQIGDSFARQRNLSLLAQIHSLCGQEQEALRYIFATLREGDKSETSLRQRYRNFFLVFPILFEVKLASAGKPAALESIRIADHLGNSTWMVQSRAVAGIAMAETGDVTAGRSLLNDSRSKATEIKNPDARERVSAFANLQSGNFERTFGDRSAAEEYYNEAVDYYDKHPDQAILREQAHLGILRTNLASGNKEALRKQIAANIKLADEYRDKIRDEDQTIGFFDLKASVYEVGAEFELDNGNSEQAYDQAEAASSRALLVRMQQREDREPLSLTEIREQMPARVRIVQFSVFEKKTVAWIISRDIFKAIPIDATAQELSSRVTSFSNSVSNVATADSSNTKTLAQELHHLLIEPVLPYLDANDELCIVPSKFLFNLPFGALIDSEGRPFVSTFRFVESPSANVFIAGTKNAESREAVIEESMLAVGNPSFDQEQFATLDYLPDAEKEVGGIAKLYSNPKSLLREQATKRAFLNSIAEADVIHFAGHYVAVPGAPMSSFLLLAADGSDAAKSELSNAELSGTSLPRTRLIVLAACRSGVERSYANEGMAGMSRTMLAARVPLVVASLWSVDSAATEALMIRFHKLRRQDHMSTTAALRQAQLDLLNDPSGKFSSPYYWAAFAVYGGHAEF
ncbi:MAG TPA: CHAT domain-containing protein [Pyrinomonadaceae bacterium]|nr:CHAT domain-containing protein [Pyrinomonadaceae bacterium]